MGLLNYLLCRRKLTVLLHRLEMCSVSTNGERASPAITSYPRYNNVGRRKIKPGIKRSLCVKLYTLFV